MSRLNNLAKKVVKTKTGYLSRRRKEIASKSRGGVDMIDVQLRIEEALHNAVSMHFMNDLAFRYMLLSITKSLDKSQLQVLANLTRNIDNLDNIMKVLKKRGIDVESIFEGFMHGKNVDTKGKGKAETAGRPYHVLVEKDENVWSIQFGDYDKNTVKEEMKDQVSAAKHFVKGKKTKDSFKIITVADDSQAAIDKAVAALNS